MKCQHSIAFLIAHLALLLLTIVVFQDSKALGQSSNFSCVAKKTCGECIRSPDCVWCAQPNFQRNDKSPLPRCNTATKHQAFPIELRCEGHYLINPNHQYQTIRDEEISRGSVSRAAVQIRPQHVKLRMRVGQPYDIHMEYAQAEDYPVDLYYLMDLSKSMEDDKEQLSNLGNTLASTMRSLTSNFRLGFGSFVDKVVMPFVSTVEKKILEPCDGCVPPYGFRNHLTLSSDTSNFSDCQFIIAYIIDYSDFHQKSYPKIEVGNARVSGNLDAPEGGFDAIMQAIVCEDQIGWRNLARRLLVFSTDASFHYAGDGKLGGIVKPNDGKCHMDSKGEYTHSTLQDYPSVAQINSKVKEKSINMIFAVTAEQIDIYKRLSANVEGATCGTLSANSSNVVELVKEEYQKITSSIELKDTASGSVRVSYFSKCLGDTMKETNTCSGLRVGTKVEFTVKVEVAECPKNRADWKQKFQIYRVGINESLTVDLEMLCECPCEIPGNPGYGERSPQCSFVGTAKCGICECDDSHFGRRCECDARSGSPLDDDRGCRKDNTTDIICFNRGTCVCGQCECQTRDDPNEKIEGEFCECDNFSCERENGELCSGSHGTCDCGKCTCRPGWSGSACQCSTDTSTCLEPGSLDICSGKGTCECGKCVCTESENERYSGRFCEKCPTCKGRCDEYKDCVHCKVHESDADCEEVCRNKPPIEVVDVVVDSVENDEHYCLFTDKRECRYYFVYGYDKTGKTYIKAQETKDCPPAPPVFWIVSGVVGAIVLIGLLFLLLWKLLTHIHDRAEYARFEKERMSAKWDTGENPIYKQATSTFKNPMYAGK